MKFSSYSCDCPYDRPDYRQLEKAALGSRSNRIAIAARLILDGHTDCRVMDCCFEMNDGAEVSAGLVDLMFSDPLLKHRNAALYSPEFLTDGIPSRWLENWQALNNPLGLFCAAC